MEISPAVINEYMDNVLKGKKPKTKKNHLSLLKTMLNYAVNWELLEFNPVSNVKPPKRKENAIKSDLMKLTQYSQIRLILF